MQITVNGESRNVEPGSTALELLRTFGVNPEGSIVELNGEIVARERFDAIALAEGDTLEIVRFVGGG